MSATSDGRCGDAAVPSGTLLRATAAPTPLRAAVARARQLGFFALLTARTQFETAVICAFVRMPLNAGM